MQTYIKNSLADQQWLLLVIGILKDSSCVVETDLEVNLDTRFDKVFLMEDFRARLFEIK